MSWIVEADTVNSLVESRYKYHTLAKRVGSGVLLPSIKDIPQGFEGRIWQNTLFTVPHDEDIAAAGEATAEDPNWGVEDLFAEGLWKIGAGGQGIKIGIADSGIDGNHPCISHQNFSRSNFAAFSLSDGQYLNIPPGDSGWHGTHCAGIIIGKEKSGVHRGVAPEATLCIARVLDGFDGSVASVKSGLDWLRLQQCDVVSLSLGWPGLHDEWATEIKSLIQGGAIVVAAAGNEYGINGSAPTRSPANYPISKLVCVGAYDRTRSVWPRSGGGQIVWPKHSQFDGVSDQTIPYLVGPGVDIVSTVPGGMYRNSDGTSMATPHIAGLLACALSYLKENGVPDAPDVALRALGESLVDIGNAGVDVRYGRGAIDPHKFVIAVQRAL